MLTKSHLIGAVVAMAIAAPAHAAVLVNNSFETGDLTGWDVSGGGVAVVTFSDDSAYPGPQGTQFTATDGDQFAELTAGEADQYVTLSQAFSLAAASRISFDAAFLRFDVASDNGDGTFSFNDDAYVRIYSATTDEVVFASSVLSVGDGFSTPWAVFTSSKLAAGDYVFEAGVRNADEGGPDFSSKLLVDNVTAAVPEPATWAMMILGFAGVGAALRRRTAAPQLA
jgi:hypothetical protein